MSLIKLQMFVDVKFYIWDFYEISFPINQMQDNFERNVGKIDSSQGILKGEVSLYRWPPVWLVWNQLYDNWQFLFLFATQTNQNQSNRGSTVQWYFPLWYSLLQHIQLNDEGEKGLC